MHTQPSGPVEWHDLTCIGGRGDGRAGFLSEILMAMMFSICTTDFLASFHRFVTRPKSIANEATRSITIEPGLGESEFFYSTQMAIYILRNCYSGTAALSALLVGVLVRYIPYRYQYSYIFSLQPELHIKVRLLQLAWQLSACI